MTSNTTKRRASRCCAVVAGWIALMVVMGPGSVVAIASSNASGFCRSGVVVRDFLKPLRSLSKSHGIPESGRLPFGPGTLRLRKPRTALVVSGSNRFELSGSLSSGPRDSRLGWLVVSDLWQVDKDGKVVSHVSQRKQFIGRVAGFKRDFGFGGRVNPGLYRLDVSFANSAGRVLGAYHEFYRAVGARSSLKLGISARTVNAGATAFLRLENFGSVDTTYSYEYQMWSVDNGRRAPVPLEPSKVSDDRPLAPIGKAGRCFTFNVPGSLSVGAYEVGIRISNRLLDKPRLVFAPFNIS